MKKMKTIYMPKPRAREYGHFAVRFYNGCSNGCAYCYLKRGALSHACGGNVPTLQKRYKDDMEALRMFQDDCENNFEILREEGLFFTFTSDPFLPETYPLFHSAIEFALMLEIPCTVLSKRADWYVVKGMKELWEFPYTLYPELLAIGFTLTGHDELEPNASSNAERIAAMMELHGMGFKTWASIEPIIDVPSAMRVIEESLDVCDHYKVGLRTGVKNDYYDPKELHHFLYWLTNIAVDFRKPIYIKDSFREMFDGSNVFDEDNKIFVDKDFSLFKK